MVKYLNDFWPCSYTVLYKKAIQNSTGHHAVAVKCFFMALPDCQYLKV